MSRVRVLQCGFPKSGNYVFYRAIREIMEEEGWKAKVATGRTTLELASRQ